MEGDAHDFFSNWQELLPPKTNYRKQPSPLQSCYKTVTTGNNSHVQEGKSQPVRGKGTMALPHLLSHRWPAASRVTEQRAGRHPEAHCSMRVARQAQMCVSLYIHECLW